GVANVATVTAGLSFAQDTYRGSGVGVSFGFGVGISSKGGIGAGISSSIGISPYGQNVSSVGISTGLGIGSNEAFNLSANIGLSYNTSAGLGLGTGMGIGYGGARTSLMDATISSKGGYSLGIGGYSGSIHQNNSSRISTDGNSWSIDVPIIVLPGVNV